MLTCSEETFFCDFNLDGCSITLAVRMTGSEEPPRNQFIDPSFVRFQIISGSCRMNRRMGFIILPPVSWPLEFPVDQSDNQLQGKMEGRADLWANAPQS